MIGDPGVDGGLGGVNPEGSVADEEVMVQGGFGEAEDLDAMMVESGGFQGEAEGNVVQVQAVAAEAVEISDLAAPRHAEADGSEDGQHARFHLPPHDSEDGFRVSDLVWSQLEGHPWWPGEIFDSADASELALKHQKSGHHLVVFFGDGSFAWCEESQLKPFMANYSEMEKQGSSDAFTIAINHALQELSRRILASTNCSCIPEHPSDNGMSYMVVSPGLKAGVICSAVNKAGMLKSFCPESLVDYVKSLALSPRRGGDFQDLVIACSQLMSFYRSKGCFGIASFQDAGGWGEDSIDSSSTKNVMLGETDTNEVQPNLDKPKRGRGRPRKRKPDTNLELMEKEPIVKPHNEPAVRGNTGETECGEFDIFVKKSAKRRRVKRHHGVDPKDSLANLSSTAAAPMNGCSLSGTAISYFSDYRNYAVSASTEVSMTGKGEGGEWKILSCPKVETTDHMQDAYWSELSLHNNSIPSLKGASGKTRPIRRRRPTWRACVSSSDHPSPAQNMQPETLGHNRKIQVVKGSIIHVDEKMVHEVNPTALVLSFGRSTDLPSEVDLIRMFSRFGPLKETETEVHKNTNTIKVVFKKRVDAERAFSVVGNFSSFGPSLRSFRLVEMPFSVSTTEMNYPKLCPEDSGLKSPAPMASGFSLNSVQVDIVGKADKDEAIKKTSVERAEMVRQAGKDEEYSLVCVNGIAEASADTMEVDSTDEIRAQTSIPRDMRAQAFTGCVANQSVEDGYVFQASQGVKS